MSLEGLGYALQRAAEVDEASDIFVLERAERDDFSREAQVLVRIVRVGVHELERHARTVEATASLEHHSHAAGAEEARELVGAGHAGAIAEPRVCRSARPASGLRPPTRNVESDLDREPAMNISSAENDASESLVTGTAALGNLALLTCAGSKFGSGECKVL
jgi:hypothetical protein